MSSWLPARYRLTCDMPGQNPNILWIVTTQWRAQACGFSGDPNARTPHLDALAASSLNFMQAVTPHPFGPFARAALLTGVPSPENGIRDYFDPLPPDSRTIAHRLRERGYATAFFGKWHLGRRDPAAPLVGEAHARTIVPPEERGGFEFWEGFESGFLLNDPWLHGTRLPEPRRFPGYQSRVVSEQAAAWWRESAAPPGKCVLRFAIVSLESPHPPYDASADGVAPRDFREIALAPNVPRGGDVEERARRELAGYYAHLEATDRAIGRLIAVVVDREGRGTALGSADYQNTIVVVTSVHGDMHGAHGLFRKGWPHEESVRVPLLVSGGTVQSGGGEAPSFSGLTSAAASLLDLPAMTLAWADGQTAIVARDHSLISMPSVVPLQDQCDRGWRGVRTAERKLVLQPDGSPWLLFDLAQDPGEMINLVDRQEWAGEVARLEALLTAAEWNS